MSDSSQLIAFLQIHLAPFDGLLRIISECVYIEYYLLVGVTLFWFGYTTLAARLSCLTLFNTLIFTGLKQFFLSTRPYMDYPELFNGWRENQWGMPSGHSQNAVVFFGTVALSIISRLLKILAVLLIITIGISRLYLGVHYLSQVLVGFALGMALIAVAYRFDTVFCQWINRHQPLQKLTLIFGLVHLPWFLTVFVHCLSGIATDGPLPYLRLAFFSGLLFGIAISITFSISVNRQDVSVKTLITKVIPGLISLTLLWQLKNDLSLLLQPIQLPLIPYIGVWLTGALISLWACWLWPKIHQRIF